MEIVILVILPVVAISIMFFSEYKFTRAQQKEQAELARQRKMKPRLAYQEELQLTWE